MAQLTGIAVVVQSKTAGQQKWQTEEEFVEDSFADPPRSLWARRRLPRSRRSRCLSTGTTVVRESTAVYSASSSLTR